MQRKMRIKIFFGIFLLSLSTIRAQNPDSSMFRYMNSAELMLRNNNGLNLGGYGEIHFNKPFTNNQKELGTLDVHRMVMFLGYNFSSKTQFYN